MNLEKSILKEPKMTSYRNLTLKEIQNARATAKAMDHIGFFYVKVSQDRWLSDSLKFISDKDLSLRKARKVY